MIGQIIESRPWPTLGVIFWVLVAVLLDVLAVALSNVHLAVASLFPWLVAVLLWRVRARPFTARFTETGLEVDDPASTVPYADLQGLLAPRRPANPFRAGPRSYVIQVIHRDGALDIPARLNVRSDEVFSFLFGRFSPGGSRDVPAMLADVLRREERVWGTERVWSYRARAHLGNGPRSRRLGAFFLALMLSGIAWLIWGIVRGEEGWMAGSFAPLMLGGLFTLLIWLVGRRPAFAAGSKWKKAGLVISPGGLALVQGELVGELRWDEVRDVKLGNSPASFQFTTSTQPPRGLIIKVEGAVIVIADVYDRPLALIYQNIRHYWQGKPRDDDWEHEAIARPPVVPGDPLPPPSQGITAPE